MPPGQPATPCPFTRSSLTVLFDGTYWVGLFERTDEHGYAVARFIFGKEPNDEELYDFILHAYGSIPFTAPQPVSPDWAADAHLSFKRRQREIERLLADVAGDGAEKAEEVSDRVRADRETQQQAQKHAAKLAREAEAQHKFELRQEKRREKRRGH